jgi:hypothetical protein
VLGKVGNDVRLFPLQFNVSKVSGNRGNSVKPLFIQIKVLNVFGKAGKRLMLLLLIFNVCRFVKPSRPVKSVINWKVAKLSTVKLVRSAAADDILPQASMHCGQSRRIALRKKRSGTLIPVVILIAAASVMTGQLLVKMAR